MLQRECIMCDQRSTGKFDGCKFICNGVEIGYECAQNCYQYFRSGGSAGMFNLIDHTGLECALKDAKAAYRDTMSLWTRAQAAVRLSAVRSLGAHLLKRKADLIKIIMWDTDKCVKEATSEVEETIRLIEVASDSYQASWHEPEQNRRTSVGVVLCWGPDGNDAFRDTFRMIIPALLAGNTVIVKIPCAGGLAHILTIDTVQKVLPMNVLQYVLGPPDELIEPIMQSGDIAMLAMAGDRHLADRLIHAHPHPHRLRLHLDLEGDVLAVITPSADLNHAARELIMQGLGKSMHTKRHLRLVMAHTSIVEALLPRLTAAMQELHCHRRALSASSAHQQPEHHQALLIDALRKGAMVVNAADGGGKLVPEFHGTVMRPAIVYPVNDTMQLWREDFRGGLLPLASYEKVGAVSGYVEHAAPGLQVSLFTSESAGDTVGTIADPLVHHAGSLVLNHLHDKPESDADSAADYVRLFEAFTQESTMRSHGSSASLSALDTSRSPAVMTAVAVDGEVEGKMAADSTGDLSALPAFSSPVSVTNPHLARAQFN